MINVEHICERKYFYWATWEGWMNLFLLSYPKYIIKYNIAIQIKIIPAGAGNFMAPAVWCAVVPCAVWSTFVLIIYTKHYCNNMSII